MNDDQLFEYLVAMGQMTPEEAELKKKQAQVESLRQQGMTSPKGQMVGNVYVAPSITQYAAQLGNAALAGQAQKQVDAGMRGMNDKQAALLEALRRKRMGNSVGGSGWGADLGQDDGYSFGGQ